jgi:hypothetical protein
MFNQIQTPQSARIYQEQFSNQLPIDTVMSESSEDEEEKPLVAAESMN